MKWSQSVCHSLKKKTLNTTFLNSPRNATVIYVHTSDVSKRGGVYGVIGGRNASRVTGCRSETSEKRQTFGAFGIYEIFGKCPNGKNYPVDNKTLAPLVSSNLKLCHCIGYLRSDRSSTNWLDTIRPKTFGKIIE